MTHPPPSDEQLLAAARRDADAFAQLYDRHAPALAQWLRRRADPMTTANHPDVRALRAALLLAIERDLAHGC